MAEEYQIGVTIERRVSTDVVVKLRANSKAEAERRAYKAVWDRIDHITDFVTIPTYDWCESGYDIDSIAYENYEGYAPDIDITDEPTEADIALQKMQLPFLFNKVEV